MLYYMRNFEKFLKTFGFMKEKVQIPFNPNNPNNILNFKEEVSIFLKKRIPQSNYIFYN